MKIIIKLLSIILLLAAIAIGLITAANNGVLDKQIKVGLQYYLSTFGVKAKFYDLKFKNGAVTASKLNIQAGTGTTQINNIKLQASLSSNFTLSIKLQPTDLKIIDENSKQIMQASINGSLTTDINGIQDTELNLPEINIIESIRDINKKPIKDGSAHFIYSNNQNQNIFKGDLQFSESIKLSISPSEKHQDNLHLHVENIPLMFYKIADKMLPNNGLLEFFKSSIQDGFIKNADINFNHNTANLSKESLNGKATILNLDYKYDDNFPILSSIDVDVIIEGAKTHFIINKAYSSEILLSNGTIDMDWKGLENTTLYVNTTCQWANKKFNGLYPSG